MTFTDFLAGQIRKRPGLGQSLTRLLQHAFPQTVIALEYPVDARPRWNEHKPNPHLYEIISRSRASYAATLRSFLQFADAFGRIPTRASPAHPSTDPCWINGWLPSLDSISLYSLLALHNPQQYVEVGSGNSTKFARRAIRDHRLHTCITSIDPWPRAEIDSICDRVVREPVERVALDTFDVLRRGDFLFIDSSHRTFMNSDVTMLFLDVLPRLPEGVFVQVHDIALPCDYPEQWTGRYYSEQYLLAAYLLGRGDAVEIVMPCAFASDDPELKAILAPIWSTERMEGVERYGGSFWFRT